MENEAKFMVDTINNFIQTHSPIEVEKQFAISNETLEKFNSAVQAADYEFALSLIPSANYLNIFDQTH